MVTDSAYKRGYNDARAELSRELQKHNTQLAARLVDTQPAMSLTDMFGNSVVRQPLDAYDRGVLNGAITANRTILMFLGHTEGEGTDKALGLGTQPGD